MVTVKEGAAAALPVLDALRAPAVRVALPPDEGHPAAAVVPRTSPRYADLRQTTSPFRATQTTSDEVHGSAGNQAST